MSQLTVKNKDMKHLLATTEEGVSSQSIANKMKKYLERAEYLSPITEPEEFTWEDIQEATWSTTSVTDDMRRMNTQRVLNEIRHRIAETVEPYRAIGGGFNTTAHQLQEATHNMLQRYRDMGAIQDFRIEDITQEMDIMDYRPTVRMNVSIAPTQSLETVRMGIQLNP
jgi:hypothetical protein